jgi:sporulation protein YlmC with PRC-barrel domain
MIRLSELEGMRVVTEAGDKLGRIWELQSPVQGKREPRREHRPVTQLVIGHRGVLERLGWRERRAVVVPWSSMLRQDGDAFVVQGNAADYESV